MRKPASDAAMVVSLFLIGNGLLGAWLSSMIGPSQVEYSEHQHVLRVVTPLWCVVEIWALGINLWAIKRGGFRWYREPVATAIVLFLLSAILFPVLFQAREVASTNYTPLWLGWPVALRRSTAHYDRHPRWPQGFEPAKSGAMLVR